MSNVEETVQKVFQDVLDVKPNEIKADESLEKSLEVDSTEMVEINVAIKKALGLDMTNSDLKKSHTYNQILDIIKEKAAA